MCSEQMNFQVVIVQRLARLVGTKIRACAQNSLMRTPLVGIIIDTIDSVAWIGNNATCVADPSCAAHSFSISKN